MTTKPIAKGEADISSLPPLYLTLSTPATHRGMLNTQIQALEPCEREAMDKLRKDQAQYRERLIREAHQKFIAEKAGRK